MEAGFFNEANMLIMSLFWPEVKIYGFEPIPGLHETPDNKRMNQPNVKLFCCIER